MARVDVTQDQVLDALLVYLRDYFDIDESRCYETVSPEFIGTIPGGDFWLTVAVGPGDFDEGLQVGGGQAQTSEEAEYLVTWFNKCKLGRTGRDTEILRAANRGLLVGKRRLLQSLGSVDIPLPSGDVFCRSLPVISFADQPVVYEKEGYAGVTIRVKIAHDWDLS